MTRARPRPALIAIGASLGGLRAVPHLLARLPTSLPIPVAIAQHRHADGTANLARLLSSRCGRRVHDANDGERWAPGRIVLAPADYHLLVDVDGPALCLDAPSLFARPSIDVLFASAARALRGGVIGVLLTGASADGAQGLRAIRERGGVTIAQDPDTCESPIAPRAAIEAGAVEHILTIEAMGPLITQILLATASFPSVHEHH